MSEKEAHCSTCLLWGGLQQPQEALQCQTLTQCMVVPCIDELAGRAESSQSSGMPSQPLKFPQAFPYLHMNCPESPRLSGQSSSKGWSWISPLTGQRCGRGALLFAQAQHLCPIIFPFLILSSPNSPSGALNPRAYFSNPCYALLFGVLFLGENSKGPSISYDTL